MTSTSRPAGFASPVVSVDPGRLEQFLVENIAGIEGRMRLDAVTHGGQSNPTYFVTFDNRQLVLRKKPDGPILPSAHAVDREFRVLAALQGSNVPVPPVVLFHATPDVDGDV